MSLQPTQDGASDVETKVLTGRRRAAAWAVALAVLSGGCTKLNAAFQDTATEGGSGRDSSVGEDGTTSGPSNTTSKADSDSGTTSSGDLGTSTGKENSEGSASGDPVPGSSSGSTGERESDTKDALPPWNTRCVFNRPSNVCPPLTEVDPHLLCILSFSTDGTMECDSDTFARLQLVLDAGAYVFGSLQLPLAQFRADQGDEEILDCTPGNPVVETDETITVDLELWNDIGKASLFYIRRVDDLCAVPDECCAPSGGSAEDACDLEELRACVFLEEPGCQANWGPACVRIAMLRCGADCT